MVITVSSHDAYPLVKLLADVSGLRKGQEHGAHTVWRGQCPQFQRAVARLRGVRLVPGTALRAACGRCLLVSRSLRPLCPQCHAAMRTVAV